MIGVQIRQRSYHVQNSRMARINKATHVTLSLYVNGRAVTNVRFRKNPEKYLIAEIDDKTLKSITRDFQELAKRAGMQSEVYMRSLGDVHTVMAQTGKDCLLAYAYDNQGNKLELGYAL